ncbi:MAG: SurA N-terminal domain-containing protein [Acidobacteriaceae bacterium]|nr:SurA N-terminal domain-containing protein [Acidobacteriaceae bacterium]
MQFTDYRLSSSAALLALFAMLPLAGCPRSHNADVVATVNGKAIMRADMDKQYQAQLGDSQQQPSQEQADAMRLQVLGNLITGEIIEQRAASMNLTATNEEVDAKLNEMKAPFTEEQFSAKLKASDYTLDQLRRDIRRNLTRNKLLAKEIDSKVSVSDADVANYYNQHKSEYNLPETTYHLAQIMVTGIPSDQPGNLQNSKASNDAEAKKKIQALKARLDSGEDFSTVAQNFSEQPNTAPSGGDMGLVLESQLHTDATAYNAVTKLKAGQITDILPLVEPQSQKQVGYAIYKLISREPAGQLELSDPSVQQHIRQQLRDGRQQLLRLAYSEMLHDQAKIQNFFAEQIFKNAAH